MKRQDQSLSANTAMQLRQLNLGCDQDFLSLSMLRAKAFVSRTKRDAIDMTREHRALHYGVFYQGGLVAAFRAAVFNSLAEIYADSHAAQYYHLHPIAQNMPPFLEIGRFCLDQDLGSELAASARLQLQAAALRMCWGAVAALALEQGVNVLFGTSSFKGADVQCHSRELAFLAQGYLASPELRPAPKDLIEFEYYCDTCANHPAVSAGDIRLPPLLRFYLTMGARVGDVAIVDRDLDTLHVFTMLNLADVPPDLKASFTRLSTLRS